MIEMGKGLVLRKPMGILTRFRNRYISEFVTYTKLLEQSLILLCELLREARVYFSISSD